MFVEFAPAVFERPFDERPQGFRRADVAHLKGIASCAVSQHRCIAAVEWTVGVVSLSDHRPWNVPVFGIHVAGEMQETVQGRFVAFGVT